MKIRLTESQYRVILKEDRVTYLKDQNVVDTKSLNQPEIPNTADMTDEEAAQVRKKLLRNKVDVTPIQGHDGIDIGYVLLKKGKMQIKLTEETFEGFVNADPSPNKQYVQWMLDVFGRHIKDDNDIDQAVRFATEDLGEVAEFLELFDFWKGKKRRFKAAKNRPNAPKNPSDIRQYKDLAHLYSVISPFMSMPRDEADIEEVEEGGESKLYKNIKSFVDLGQADIVYHDPSVVVYVPNHVDASCGPLGPLASWCTRQVNNSYFDSYRKNDPRPDGSWSKFYVILPKELFDMDNPSEHASFPYQFHFESNQIHNKNNKGIGSAGVSKLMSDFPGLAEFFRKELGQLAADAIRGGNGLMDNKYIKFLNDFGGKTMDYVPEEAYSEGVTSIKKLAKEGRGPINNNKYLQWLLSNEDGINIIDYIPLDIEDLSFNGINLGKLPDLSMFENCGNLSATGCNITEMPPYNELPPNVNIITLHENQITNVTLDGYDKLETLLVVNLFNNPIKTIDLENLYKLLKTEQLARLALPDPETNLDNYPQFKALVLHHLINTEEETYIDGIPSSEETGEEDDAVLSYPWTEADEVAYKSLPFLK